MLGEHRLSLRHLCKQIFNSDKHDPEVGRYIRQKYKNSFVLSLSRFIKL